MPHDMRDQVIDFVRRWNERMEIATQRFVRWLGLASSKFYDWRARYGHLDHAVFITLYQEPYAAVFPFQPLAAGTGGLTALLLTAFAQACWLGWMVP